MWCWKKEYDKLRDHARNEGLLHKVKEETNIPHKIKRKSDRIGHILRMKCLIKRIIGWSWWTCNAKLTVEFYLITFICHLIKFFLEDRVFATSCNKDLSQLFWLT
jgi:hypothetical protein